MWLLDLWKKAMDGVREMLAGHNASNIEDTGDVAASHPSFTHPFKEISASWEWRGRLWPRQMHDDARRAARRITSHTSESDQPKRVG